MPHPVSGAPTLGDIAENIRAMAQMMAEWAVDSAQTMTCTEIDSMLTVLAWANADDDAHAILLAHAYNDEVEDQHWLGEVSPARPHDQADVVLHPPSPENDHEFLSVTVRDYVARLR